MKGNKTTSTEFTYPAMLNKNIVKFEGYTKKKHENQNCEEVANDFDQVKRPPTSIVADGKDDDQYKCGIGGDLILLRFSSYLYKILNSKVRGRPCTSSISVMPSESCIILPNIFPSTRPNRASISVENDFLNKLGIEEVESLQVGGASTGQCQFSSIAAALTARYEVRLSNADGYRPDLELRKLALHAIHLNQDMYQQFLTRAGGRTRAKSNDGGMGVDCRAYLRSMSSPTCDGDAVTLQALCDALRITVRIVKAVDADIYNEANLFEKLRKEEKKIPIPPEFEDEDSATFVTPVIEAEDGNSSSNTSLSSRASSNDVDQSAKARRKGHGLKRLFISSEICPRELANIDDRIKDVRRVVEGQLIWLSHIGNEAHYRFLRPVEARFSSVSFGYRLPISKKEAMLALLCQRERRIFYDKTVVPVAFSNSFHGKRNVLGSVEEDQRRKTKRTKKPVALTNISYEDWKKLSYS